MNVNQMKKIACLFFLMFTLIGAYCQQDGEIRLLVRADDMASFHDANVACINSATGGIAKSIEVMVPCAWFPEAVQLLNENPSVDVGLHLVLTSEWETIKWRPLTQVPSLLDSNGYFFPFIWKFGTDTIGRFLNEVPWKLDEIEQELRAQIELGLKHLPQTTHLSAHMGFTSLSPGVKDLFENLAREYSLKTESAIDVKRFPGWGKAVSKEDKIKRFVENIKALQPGTYLFVEHPGLDGPEMQAVKSDVAEDRQHVTDIFTHKLVQQALLEKGVKLVSYSDLFRLQPN